ncbi:peptide deformylase [Flavilitoribacter nigricans]|uniref:Peptide deformylase n=1 Tax=Flavilitoribacter nigricans (strain ATCC 23147 / DSM 23189 / NBRC 102662 / NCIMB 1420 / SS-2) TaxID=1122177 RepID=A0A2D0N5H5_FLAN2|nr:peptide deformylase [Flavilitoribacter nigricans]PHN03754.1 formylmethionine deformylase [Flavilitoribacter nigricans DSM 23189 = NBRC 102662]
MLDQILLLGDPRLYEKCEPVRAEEVADLQPTVDKMAACILAFREKYGAGRAIAAPQIGVMKRLVVMNVDRPVAFYNPELVATSDEMMELWDDCMSFPNLLVRLQRHRRCTMRFRDAAWEEQTWELEDDLSELMQHELDHLDGILATMRAENERALRWRS